MIGVIDVRSKALREARVLLLRHAETSAPDRFHGAESDVGLGPAGHLQAEAVAKRLAAFGPDALYCSGMRRARETARPIGLLCNLTPEIIPQLHERRIGPLSGTTRDESWCIYAEAKAKWISGDLDHTHEGGESYADIRRRVVPVLEALAERHQGQTIVVVAHGVVIRVLLTSVLADRGPERFDSVGIDFVAINDLRWNGEAWRTAELNSLNRG